MDKNQLVELKKKLKDEFGKVFDKKAFDKYYAGKELVNGKMVDFDDGFNHQAVASSSNLKFVHLHLYLGNYFMAYALDRATTSDRYRQEKEDLLEAFKKEAPLHPLKPEIEITDENVQEAIDEVEKVAELLLQEYGYAAPSAA